MALKSVSQPGPMGPDGGTGQQGSQGIPGVNSFSTPHSRSLSMSTAFQATDNTKPAMVMINLASTAALTLTAGTINSANVLVGSTNAVASGTGTIVGIYTNSMAGSLVIGLNINTAAAYTCSFGLPTGFWFAIVPTSGTVTISSAFDQGIG